MNGATTVSPNSTSDHPQRVALKYSQIIQQQPTHNIGCLGSVSEGKSTTVRFLSKHEPHQHQKERERNSTINLGYANFKIWQHPETKELVTTKGNVKEYHSKDGSPPVSYNLVRHLSFVDCPGHENFMTTMMSGTGVMDGVLLLIGANSPTIPLRQTQEHMAVLERTDIDQVLVLQNKIDLLDSSTTAIANRDQIQAFLKTTKVPNASIIPVSAQFGINMDHVLERIVRDYSHQEMESRLNQSLSLSIIRSFDVNKPGTPGVQLKGGVIGGSISQGFLRVGDPLEIRPGIRRKLGDKTVWTPFLTRVTSINIGTTSVEWAVPGGLIGLGTDLDPFWTVSNKMAGQVAGHPGHLPAVWSTVKVEILEYLIPDLHFLQFKKDESVLLITGSNVIRAKFGYSLKYQLASLELEVPVCLKVGTKIAVARFETEGSSRSKSRSKLAFIGVFRKGIKVKDYYLPCSHSKYQLREEITVENDLVDRSTSLTLEPELSLDSHYRNLLANFQFAQEKSSFRIPLPQVIIENRKTAVGNAQELIHVIHSQSPASKNNYQELFRKFLNKELMKQTRYTGAGALLIDGIFQSPKIQSVISKYVEKYVLCEICKAPETLYEGGYVRCFKCGAQKFLKE